VKRWSAVAGAYAGAGIQYIVPVSLVWLARRRLGRLQEETKLTLGRLRFRNPLYVFVL
jgi:hypothetical protein